MLPQASTAVAVDLCPIVPAACIVEAGNEVIDNVNPFKSFWDAFFVSSPQEALETPLRLIMSVPKPNFDADWFREAYANVLAFYGMGFAVLVFAISLAFSLAPNHTARTALDGLIDLLWTMLQIAFMPVFSGGILWASSSAMQAILGWVDVKDSDDFLAFFSPDFFAVGWMSLLARAVGLALTVEVVAFYLIQIFATLTAPIVIPLRGMGDFGRMWYVRMIRGILLGFAPVVMAFVLAAFVLVLNYAPSLGSAALFQFVGAIVGMVAAAVIPLRVVKKSRVVVTNAALRLAEVRFKAGDSMQGAMMQSASSANLDRYVNDRRGRTEARKNVLRDGVSLGVAAYTGGASAAVGALVASRSNAGQRTLQAFRRTQSTIQKLDKGKKGDDNVGSS